MKKGVTLQLNISDRSLYVLIAIGIFLIAGVGVYAYNSGMDPSTMGHTWDELECDDDFCATGSKLGIGTETPSSALTVAASATGSAGGIRLLGYTDETDVNYWSERMFVQEYGNSIKTVLDANGDNYLNGGDVGIGTSSPSAKLDVNGDIKADEVCLGSDCRSSWSSCSWVEINEPPWYVTTKNTGIDICADEGKICLFVTRGPNNWDSPSIETSDESMWIMKSCGIEIEGYNEYEFFSLCC